MHGAAVAMTLHMSIGTPRCCGVIEIFNPSEAPVGSYLFHGNTLRSMGILYRRVPSAQKNDDKRGDPRERTRRMLQGHAGGKDKGRRVPLAEQGTQETHLSDRRKLTSNNYEYQNAGYSFDVMHVVDVFKAVISELTGQKLKATKNNFNFNGPSCVLPGVVADPYLEG